MRYRFTIPTNRAVRVTLAQPGTNITAGDAGFAVYKVSTCLPSVGDISPKLTPIGTFGNTYHPCVDSGMYFIQVSANEKANGPLFIQLQVSDSTGAAYDHPENAYDFGVVTPHTASVDYSIDCQSIEDANEICAALFESNKYHKSSWHTFTTPDYFDYLSILLSGNKSGYFINWATQVKFGYRIYKGNARNTPITSLLSMGNCDSMMTNGYNAAYRMFKCSELETNTTYSIQIFAHEDFYNDIRLGIAVGGT